MVFCVIERTDAMDFFPLSAVQSRLSVRVFWCTRHTKCSNNTNSWPHPTWECTVSTNVYKVLKK